MLTPHNKRLITALFVAALATTIIIVAHSHHPYLDANPICSTNHQAPSSYNSPQKTSPRLPAHSTDNWTPIMAAPIKGEIILVRQGYTCSYNPLTLQPNYVSWTISPQKLNGQHRREQFYYEDPDLQPNQKAYLRHYYNSGYDRGHMCPAGDNKWSHKAMKESFYLSNVCPQTHTLNSQDWEELESMCRYWVRRNQTTIYVTCGPIFSNTTHKKANRTIPVPEKFFKAIICITPTKQQGIAFIYNNDTTERPMQQYVCTISDIEKITGYKLFTTLPKNVQKTIKNQANLMFWRKGFVPRK